MSRLTPSKRIYLAFLFTLLLYAIFAAGSLAELSSEEIEEKFSQITQITKGKITAIGIFLNNYAISLLMLIPLLGPIIGGYIIYNTGTFLAAIAASTGESVALLLAVPILTFYGFLEFLGYGVMVSESVVLFYSIIKKRLIRELRSLPLMIGLASLFLGAAALLEFSLIAVMI